MSQNQHTPMLNTPFLHQLEKLFIDHQVDIESWFRQQWLKTPPLFYASVDLRNAGFKLAPVDTNLFPAGFNNLNPQYLSLYVQAVEATIAEICPDVTRLLLIPESHSRNTFYFESVAMLCDILRHAGFLVHIASLNPEVTEPQEVSLPSGRQLLLEPLIRREDQVGVKDFFPCCIILNNDLSSGVPEILQNLKQNIMPTTELGWATRLKSEHFHAYDLVANEFAKLLNIDPWFINPYFEQCSDVDFLKREGEACLVERADIILSKTQKKYDEYGITHKPFLVIKADAGTYGMAVMTVENTDMLLSLNRKQRTRMSAGKGGVAVNKVILQEGVYTFETAGDEGAVAEPVVYMMGRHVIGGFYRAHKGRGTNENLNTPGMDFLPIPFQTGCNTPRVCQDGPNDRFYLYGVIARLAALAAARELIVSRGN